MSVVVNEWEVVPEGEPPAGGPEPPPAPAAPSPSMAVEIEKTIRRLRERALRLLAD